MNTRDLKMIDHFYLLIIEFVIERFSDSSEISVEMFCGGKRETRHTNFISSDLYSHSISFQFQFDFSLKIHTQTKIKCTTYFW
jgi:hypothetical protein